MIDLHCHLLPGVDDGAPDMAAALALARAAVANGITASVLTPHIYFGRWDNGLSSLRATFFAFREELAAQGIPLEVSLGGEVHLLPEAFDLLSADDLPFIGGWRDARVLLLELPDGHVPVAAYQAVERFLAKNVIPMIAHPERNKAVMRDPRVYDTFVRMGCLTQLTAASVCGMFGKNAHRTALQLLDSGAATVIATDAHNLRARPPVLAEARAAITERFGPQAGMVLTESNPAELLRGRALLLDHQDP
ncbi:MAG: CpsB/CapC family capsule biosynthesis tyrosine phosphatase [Burkholderiaceae bacterium]